MGTSLSGLTPATTFDGLLKVGDNDPLTATLKPISTGEGTDTILSLSNSALSIGGDVSITGTTSDDTTNSLLIERLDGTDLFQVRNDRNIYFGSTQYIRNGYRFYGDWEAYGIWDFNSDVNIGTGTGIANTRLLVKGSGATSATTSLLVQNSAGSELFKVTDDGAIDFGALGLEFSNDGSGGTMSVASDRYVKIATSLNTYSALNAHVFKTLGSGGYSEAMRITGNTDQFVGIGETTPTAKLHVKVGTTQDTIARFQDPLNASTYIDIKNDSVLTDYVGLFWGSTAKIRSKEVGSIFFDVSQAVVFADGNAAKSKIYSNGSMSIGASTIPSSTMAYIKGSGATSATTALLVQNSAGTDMLKVQDDGITTFGQDGGSGSVPTGFEFQPYLSVNPTWGPSIKSYYNNNKWLQIEKGARYYTFADSGLGVNMDATPTARLQVKGSGSTSATYALKAQNSGGETMFSIRDDKTIQIDGSRFTFNSSAFTSYADILLNTDLAVGTTTIAANTRAHIKGSGNDNTTTALLVQNSDGGDMVEVLDSKRVNITAADGATGLHIDSVNGSTTGNALTFGSDDNRFRLGNYYNYGVISVPNSKILLTSSAGVGIGNTFTNANSGTARLFVKGSGATSATTALLVQNSAGTDLLKVEDGGDVKIDNGVAADMKVNISPTTNKYIELDRQGRQVRLYSGASGNAGIFMTQADKFSIGTNNSSLLLLDENSNVKIGSGITSADTSAKLQVDSTTQGFLPPRMTTTERDAITTPAAGLMIYDTTNNQMNYWNGSSWIAF